MNSIPRRSTTGVLILLVSCLRVYGDSFTGCVRNAETGAPIEGAKVVAGAQAGAEEAFYSCITDSSGHYEIPAVSLLGEASFTLIASAPGYASGYSAYHFPPGDLDFDLDRADTGFLVHTVNQGIVQYEWNGSFFYRTDGAVWSPGDPTFRDLNSHSDAADRLLYAIGAGTNRVSDARTIWARCGTVWDWLGENTYFAPWDANYNEAAGHLMENGWPSPQRIAETWEAYGYIPWLACFSRAHILITLLYRCGIPPECLAMPTTRLAISDTEHFYVAVQVGGSWLYIDPAAIGQPFPAFEERHSIPLRPEGTEDRDHPYSVIVLPVSRLCPGSRLAAVPELNRRESPPDRVRIASPPNGAVTTGKGFMVSGFADKGIGFVTANGRRISVTRGRFEFLHAAPPGESTLTVEAGDLSGSDSITLHRYRRGTGAEPWWP